MQWLDYAGQLEGCKPGLSLSNVNGEWAPIMPVDPMQYIDTYFVGRVVQSDFVALGGKKIVTCKTIFLRFLQKRQALVFRKRNASSQSDGDFCAN